MKKIFTLMIIIILVLADCGDENSSGNGKNKTTLTIINLAYGNYELTYGTVVFNFTFNDSDEITKEVNAGTNYIYINDLAYTNYMKELGISVEAVYRTVEPIICEEGKKNQFTLTDNTIVTMPGGYKGSGDITDTMRNVGDILANYIRKDVRNLNKMQTWFLDTVEEFNIAPDDTTHTITLTESFEFPAGGNYRNSYGWSTLFKKGKNKKIIIQGDSNVRTITNNGKQFDGYSQLETGGYLFLIPDGITLELGKNIILNGNSVRFPVIYVEKNGTFIMNNDSTITGNSATAVISAGTFIMNGGTIKGNNSNKYDSYGGVSFGGGGVNIYYGTFTMNNGIIRDNTVYGNGGGVLVDSGTFIMKGGTISGNRVIEPSPYFYNSCGGGVCVLIDGTFIKTGGTIDNTNMADVGKVAYVANEYQKRETTAGPTDNMDSSKTGAAGGWE